MQESVHISQFYACSNVSLAVELQYIVELGKYLFYRGMCLSVDGVAFDDILRKSRFWGYFSMAVTEGWVVDCPCKDAIVDTRFPVNYDVHIKNVLLTEEDVPFDNDEHVKRKNDAYYAYKTPLRKQVIFSEKDDISWVWSLGKTDANRSTMCSYGSEDTWVSFIAYVAVARLFDNQPQLLMIEIGYELTQTHMLMSSFLLLQNETDVCSGWCFYSYAPNVTKAMVNHIEYTAWYAKGKEMGVVGREYNALKKHKHMSELDLKVGDIVFLYERSTRQKSNFIKEIAGFHFARIDKIDKQGVLFYIINTKKTLYQGELDYADYPMSIKVMYNRMNPFATLNARHENISWLDLGVEYFMCGEKYFIIPCTPDDEKVIWVRESDWTPVRLHLNAIELTYWILKDFGVDFNEERFIKRYFSDVPLYQQYLDTGIVPEKYIANREVEK